jgi:hypothetical protein
MKTKGEDLHVSTYRSYFSRLLHLNMANATFLPVALSLTNLLDRTLLGGRTSLGPSSLPHPTALQALTFAEHCTRNVWLLV